MHRASQTCIPSESRYDGQMVRHVLAAGGLTLKHLELGGVEGRDLAAIRDTCLGTRSEA
jgi:hypothetical protein